MVLLKDTGIHSSSTHIPVDVSDVNAYGNKCISTRVRRLYEVLANRFLFRFIITVQMWHILFLRYFFKIFVSSFICQGFY